MSDTFSYNSVTINNPLVDIIDAQAVYDDGDVSVVYTKVVYRVQGTIQGTSVVDWNTQQDAAESALMVPRGHLIINMGGQDIVNTSADDKTGPTPRTVKFTEIVGAIFCIVTFEIECNFNEKCAANQTQAILSHSWTVSHSIDDMCLTTRTTRGKIIGNPNYRANTSPTAITRNVDLLRGSITPTIPTDFRRERMDFLRSANGLELSYEIVDKEQYRPPPPSMIKSQGRFGHQMDRFVYFNHMTLECSGNKQQPKLAMFNDMVKVALSRFDFTGNTELIIGSSLEEDLYENVIRWQITSQCVAAARGTTNLPLFPANSKIFTFPGDQPNHVIDSLGPYGSSGIAAALCVPGGNLFFDPCKETSLRLAVIGPGATSGELAGNTASNTGSAAPTDSPSSVLSTDQTTAAYTHFENNITYEQPNGCTILPSTKGTVPGKVYQWHVPYQMIVQKGCALRTNAPVVVPPPQPVIDGTLVYKRITPIAPQPNPDQKNYQFGATWEYHIIAPLASGDLKASGNLVDATPAWNQQPTNSATTYDPTTGATALAPVAAPITITGA